MCAFACVCFVLSFFGESSSIRPFRLSDLHHAKGNEGNAGVAREVCACVGEVCNEGNEAGAGEGRSASATHEVHEGRSGGCTSASPQGYEGQEEGLSTFTLWLVALFQCRNPAFFS